jgi:hypothetical protein
MRLNPREIDQEFEESIADGKTLTGSRTSSKTRVRPPYSSRDRDYSTEGRRRGSGAREKKEKESTL